LSPVAPLEPVGPVETDFVERLVFGFSVLSEDSFSFLETLVLEDVFNLTSKTEYNEENKSVTTMQIVSSSSIDEGKGFLESPIISEKIPSFTFKWKLPCHIEENCFERISSSVGFRSVIEI